MITLHLLFSYSLLLLQKRISRGAILFITLFFCLSPSILQAQTSSSTTTKLAEGNLFTIELVKDIFCGKDAVVRAVPKNNIGHLTNIGYTLEENFGTHFKNRSDEPQFTAISDDSYTMVITAVNTTTNKPFEERITFIVPTPPATPQRDYALYDNLTRVSILDKATGKDLSTGQLALKLKGGKGIATTTISITSYIPPTEYSPLHAPTLNSSITFTNSTEPDVYLLDGEYPAGTYVFDIFDGCLGVPLTVKFEGKELKELMPPAISFNYCEQKMNVQYGTSWVRSAYLYFGKSKTEVSFAPKGKPFTTWYAQTAYNTNYPLTDAEVAAIDAAGGYQVGLRYTELPGYICVAHEANFSSKVTLNSIDWGESYISNRGCSTWDGWCPWFRTTSYVCNPQIIVTKKGTSEQVKPPFNSLTPGAVTGWPLNTDLVATAYVNGKVLASKEFRVDRQPPYIDFTPVNDIYHSNCVDVYVVAKNASDECLPMLRIKDKNGVVVYNQRMATRNTLVPCLNLGEEYTAEFHNYETSTTPIAGPSKFTRTLPTKLTMYGYNIQLCDHYMTPWIDWDGGFSSGQTKNWPIGSVWTFEGVDVVSSILPFKYTYVHAPRGYFYLPTGSYPPGKYKVTIDMDPNSTTDTPLVYYFDFAGGYQQDKPLRIEVSNECTNFTIVPRDGTYILPPYLSNSDAAAKDIHLERQKTDGSWEYASQIYKDTPYTTTQKGHYRAYVAPQVGAGPQCKDYITEFDLDLPNPKLKYYSTFSYYCGKAKQSNPAEAGTILIEAEDGTPPYSYYLYELDPTKPGKMGNLVASVLNKPAGEQISFTGLDVKSYITRVEDGCKQYFFHEDIMRPFSDLARAFVRKSVVCQGEPIELFTYRIKGVSFHWTKVGDPSFTHAQQNERDMTISNAQVSDGGTYQLSVKDESCDNGTPFVTTVNVQVIPQFSAARLSSTATKVCWQEPIRFHVSQHTHGRAPYTYQWEWSDDDGATWKVAEQQTQQQLSFVPPATPGLLHVWLRCQVTDACGTVITTNKSHAEIFPCYAPINPQLMHRSF